MWKSMSIDPEIKRNYVSVPSGRLSRLINLTGMSVGITGNILFSAANNFFNTSLSWDVGIA